MAANCVRETDAMNRTSVTLFTLWVLLGLGASACSSGQQAQEVTEEAVDLAWAEAAECFTNAGYSVRTQRTGNEWGVVFDGIPEERNELFFERYVYDNCVDDAAAITTDFLRTQIPEGAERLEMAAEFEACLSSAGVTKSAYDPNNPDQPAVLRDAQRQLGYGPGDPTVVDDPRFGTVLQCLGDFELLFPHRIEDRR